MQADVVSFPSDGEITLDLLLFVENLSRKHLVSTVLGKLALASIGLLGIIEVSSISLCVLIVFLHIVFFSRALNLVLK